MGFLQPEFIAENALDLEFLEKQKLCAFGPLLHHHNLYI
jgi:hypothetical protein